MRQTPDEHVRYSRRGAELVSRVHGDIAQGRVRAGQGQSLPVQTSSEKRHDHGLWLSILKKGHTAYGLNEVLGEYRIRGGSISDNKIAN